MLVYNHCFYSRNIEKKTFGKPDTLSEPADEKKNLLMSLRSAHNHCYFFHGYFKNNQFYCTCFVNFGYFIFFRLKDFIPSFRNSPRRKPCFS